MPSPFALRTARALVHPCALYAGGTRAHVVELRLPGVTSIVGPVFADLTLASTFADALATALATTLDAAITDAAAVRSALETLPGEG